MEENPYATHAELGLMQGFPPPEEKRVDRTNSLFTPPYNRWSYQNMRQLFPTAGISGAATSIPLRRHIDGGIDELTVRRASGEPVDVDTWLRESYTDALVVVKDGVVVWERYLNGMHADQPHQMMSVTKSFAGLFGLMAAAAGHLSEDDLVTALIPELASSGAFDEATCGQVFDMTNAMDFSEDYADPASGIVEYSKVLGFLEAPADEIPANSIYEYLVGLPKLSDFEHGEAFFYQTPKTDVVNWITNRATGKSFQDMMADDLWAKLGADGETYVLLDKNGTLFAGGGLNATPNDLARFGAMMTNSGRFNGQQVVSDDVIESLAAGASTEAFLAGPDGVGLMADGHWSYRAQWWVRRSPGKESFSAIGIHGQWIYLDTQRGVAIVKQSSQPVSDSVEYTDFNINAFDAIISHLT